MFYTDLDHGRYARNSRSAKVDLRYEVAKVERPWATGHHLERLPRSHSVFLPDFCSFSTDNVQKSQYLRVERKTSMSETLFPDNGRRTCVLSPHFFSFVINTTRFPEIHGQRCDWRDQSIEEEEGFRKGT